MVDTRTARPGSAMWRAFLHFERLPEEPSGRTGAEAAEAMPELPGMLR